MDSASKQTAIVAEVTQGVMPNTPGFLVLRDTSLGGNSQIGNTRSPERNADRMEHNSVRGINAFTRTIQMPWVRDAGLDLLWASLFCAAPATNVFKNGATIQPFSSEEKYEGGATDPYIRHYGGVVDSVQISGRMDGSPLSLAFQVAFLTRDSGTTAKGGATYAAPSPGYDPVSGVDVVVNDLFGISGAKLMAFTLNIRNNLRQQYAMGSAAPWGTGLGIFEVEGTAEIYFRALADWSTFATSPQDGLTFDLTIGSQTNYKDRLVIPAARVLASDSPTDPGQSGDHTVVLPFRGRYYAGDTAAAKLTRNVA